MRFQKKFKSIFQNFIVIILYEESRLPLFEEPSVARLFQRSAREPEGDPG